MTLTSMQAEMLARIERDGWRLVAEFPATVRGCFKRYGLTDRFQTKRVADDYYRLTQVGRDALAQFTKAQWPTCTACGHRHTRGVSHATL